MFGFISDGVDEYVTVDTESAHNAIIEKSEDSLDSMNNETRPRIVNFL